jgi:hypothetical protein
MDLRQANKAQSGRIRRLTPFDIEELGNNRDPKFWIEVREETIAEIGKRLTEFKIKSNQEDHLKAIRAGMAGIIAQIKNWGDLFDNGVAMECTEANKRIFAEARWPVLDEWKTGWQLTTEALDRQMREELGNAQSSSDTTSASA